MKIAILITLWIAGGIYSYGSLNAMWKNWATVERRIGNSQSVYLPMILGPSLIPIVGPLVAFCESPFLKHGFTLKSWKFI